VPGYPQPVGPASGYPPAANPDLDPYGRVRAKLQTVEGFGEAVSYHNASNRVINGVLTIFAAALGWNLVSTIRSLLQQSINIRYFLDVFLSVQDARGGVNPWFVFIVWGPLVCIPVVIVVLIVRKATWKSSLEKGWQRYKATGFLAPCLPVGVVIGNSKFQLAILASPLAPPPQVAAIANYLGELARDPKSPAAKEFNKRLVKARLLARTTVAAAAVDQTLPPGLFFTALAPAVLNGADIRQRRPFVVIPGDQSKAQIFTLKPNEPIG
jgi:hypothetical protein